MTEYQKNLPFLMAKSKLSVHLFSQGGDGLLFTGCIQAELTALRDFFSLDSCTEQRVQLDGLNCSLQFREINFPFSNATL